MGRDSQSVRSIGQLGQRGQPGGSQTKIGHQSLGPKIGQRPSGHQFGHKSHRTHFWPWTTMDQYCSHGLWQPPEATRSAQSAFPSTYGEFFPFLHTIRT
ncbi:hypothetical protein O181_106707 [Austropuccinia psidii MF-1]|uniref:Uncharacterized protein n=1 Tax=Austropuccinia psidii MF-1 TaxID=1389203 RepID=A0A9Q3PNM3_9BASI|nr:hypothetical protein [Austropuccinia psidii MF-1]